MTSWSPCVVACTPTPSCPGRSTRRPPRCGPGSTWPASRPTALRDRHRAAGRPRAGRRRPDDPAPGRHRRPAAGRREGRAVPVDQARRLPRLRPRRAHDDPPRCRSGARPRSSAIGPGGCASSSSRPRSRCPAVPRRCTARRSGRRRRRLRPALRPGPRGGPRRPARRPDHVGGRPGRHHADGARRPHRPAPPAPPTWSTSPASSSPTCPRAWPSSPTAGTPSPSSSARSTPATPPTSSRPAPSCRARCGCGAGPAGMPCRRSSNGWSRPSSSRSAPPTSSTTSGARRRSTTTRGPSPCCGRPPPAPSAPRRACPPSRASATRTSRGSWSGCPAPTPASACAPPEHPGGPTCTPAASTSTRRPSAPASACSSTPRSRPSPTYGP